MKNKIQKLFQKLKNENRVYLSVMSFLTLAIMGMLFQSFTMNVDSSRGMKRTVEYDETVKTTYSFGCDLSQVSKVDLLKSRPVTENKHIRMDINANNEVIITTTNLDQPTSAHDLKHLVQKVVWTGDKTRMYDYKGKEIVIRNQLPSKELFKRTVTNEGLDFFGVKPTLKMPTSQEMVQIRDEGKQVETISSGKFSISDTKSNVTFDVNKKSVDVKLLERSRPFDRMKTYYKDLGEGKSIQAVSIIEREETMPSGQVRTMTVTSTRTNQVVQKDGVSIYGGKLKR